MIKNLIFTWKIATSWNTLCFNMVLKVLQIPLWKHIWLLIMSGSYTQVLALTKRSSHMTSDKYGSGRLLGMKRPVVFIGMKTQVVFIPSTQIWKHFFSQRMKTNNTRGIVAQIGRRVWKRYENGMKTGMKTLCVNITNTYRADEYENQGLHKYGC